MFIIARIAMGLSLLCLGSTLAAAEQVVPPTTPPPTDGSCLHHTLADKNIVVKLANGEKYDDRYPKKDAGSPGRNVVMPQHTFLCTNGRLTQLQ